MSAVDLNAVMEFDHVILVHEDGSISAPETAPPAPELYADSDADGQHLPTTDRDLQRDAERAGWTLETGWTGQYGYSGPCMHASEYVGGGLAEHILSTPGYWVVVMIYENDDSDPSCWAIAHRDA